MRGLSRLTLAAALLLAGALSLHAEPLKVMSAGAVSGALTVLAPDFTKASGIEVKLVFGNVGMIEDRLKAGERADLLILTAPAMEKQRQAGGLAGAVVPLGRTGMGLAAKSDAPKPDISTPDKFKAALLAAKSIAYSDPAGGGSSGIYFDRLIEKLGIAEAIRQKAVLIRGGSAADRVVSGEAELAVQNVSELLGVPGIALVGAFPAEYQNYALYAAGIPVDATRLQEAEAFLRHLSAPEAAATWRAAGIVPADLQ